jgi:adenosylcobinamide-GDP ribazoletransferase
MPQGFRAICQQIASALIFYTCIPLPERWPLAFDAGLSRSAPLIGLLIGTLQAAADTGLAALGMPQLTRSALVVAQGLGITGGLHLDGAIDTADGLAVLDPDRRLSVMSDSTTGAFGVMAGVVILGLKLAALSQVSHDRWFVLMAVAGWSRWGQLVAIARYPYLKPTGKGAFHKEAIRSVWAALPSGLLLIGLSVGSYYWVGPKLAVGVPIGGVILALGIGDWLNRRLGGQTGDTYGAIVEWTEALLLCWATVLV